MRYVVNSTTAYGLYNGLSDNQVYPIVKLVAEELGLNPVIDCNVHKIVRQLNTELLELAVQTYIPYPPRCEDKNRYEQDVRLRKATGEADIPENIIKSKVRAILQEVADEVLPLRAAQKARKEEELNQLHKVIKDIETTERKITDEGGLTKEYTHRVTFQSGRVLTFSERNVFDVGRVINPLYSITEGVEQGGISCMRNGVWMWSVVDGHSGFVDVRPLDEEEIAALMLIEKYHGFYNSNIRM